MRSGEASPSCPTVVIPRKGARVYRSHAVSTFFFFATIILTVAGGGYAALHYAHPDVWDPPTARKKSAPAATQATRERGPTPGSNLRLPSAVVDPPTSPVTYTTFTTSDDPPEPAPSAAPRSPARPVKATRPARAAAPRARHAAPEAPYVTADPYASLDPQPVSTR